MKKFICGISLVMLTFTGSVALSQNKVVVVPLGSSQVGGSDGQFQYNNNGKIAGSEVYYIKDQGRVGIGTTSTGTKLVVQGNGSHWSEGFISLKNNNNDAGIRLYHDESSVSHHIFNSYHEGNLLRIVPGAAGSWDEGIALQQDGNVGIGTKSPVTKLEVTSVIWTTPTDSPGVCDHTSEGAMYYDNSLAEPCFCNGTGWQQFDGGGGC